MLHARRSSCVVPVGVLILVSVGCARQPANESVAKEPAANHTPVKIAVLLDTSGAQQSLGKPSLEGFKLAMKEADANVDWEFVDTQTNDEVTKQVATDLAPQVAIGTGFTNNESLLVAGPVFQKEDKAFLSIGATDPALPEDVGDCIFLACFGDNTQAAAAAEFAHREFGDTTAILWNSTTPYTRMLPKYFRTRYEELGGKVLLDESFDDCDLADLGKRIKELPEPPAFVYLSSMPQCVGDIIASLRAAGVDAPIVGGDGLDTPNVLKSKDVSTTGVWFTTHAWLSEETGTEEAKAFVQAYAKEYGRPPGDAFAALGYDAGQLLLDAIGRAEGKSAEDLAAALAATRDYQGVTGTISFSEGRHVPLKTVWIIRVEDGQQLLATSFVPKSVPPPILSKE